jgi:hypothetical protein
MADDSLERLPIKNLVSEPSAHELATSLHMEPYLQFAMAVMQDADPRAKSRGGESDAHADFRSPPGLSAVNQTCAAWRRD